MAVRCNTLALIFARCTVQIKTTLFKAYYQSFYTLCLRSSFIKKYFIKVIQQNGCRVQHNNSFRVLMWSSPFCSTSGMFAADSFAVIMHKRWVSLTRRLHGSTNSTLSVFVERENSPYSLAGRDYTQSCDSNSHILFISVHL